MLHFRTPLALAALAVLLTACGGGGGGSSPIPSTGGGSSPMQPAQSAPASMVIYIPPPSKQNTHFRPNYISPGTQSMTVGLVSGSTTSPLVTINLTTSSPNCTVPTGGGLQCTATVQAPFGTDTFAVSTYSATNAGGSVLSTGQVQVTLTRGGTEPTVQLDLDGVPVSVSLVLGTATLPVGYAGATSVIVQALDASGNLIIGPGLFATPFALSITGDTYQTLSLNYGPGQTSVTSPGQAVTLEYNGNSNVGSTITPTGSGISGTGVTFNATGASLTMFQYLDPVTGLYIEPYSIAAFPSGGTAAVLADINYTDCDCDPEGIAVASTSTLKQVFIGDTTDPYVLPSEEPSDPGATIVHGMSAQLESDFADNIGAGPNGIAYYGGDINTESDPNHGCNGNSEYTGTLGALNTSAGTATEIILKGYIGPIKVDSAGNVWFLEESGYCYDGETYTYFLGAEYAYAIGELPAGSSTVIETPFSSAGLSGFTEPEDLSITPDGTKLIIADYDSGIAEFATAALSAPTATIVPNFSARPYTVSAGPDGTALWFSTSGGEGSSYFYGYVPGSNFAQGSLAEVEFPVPGFESYASSYADGSFWASGENDGSVGRVSGLIAPTPAPINGFYQLPPANDEQNLGSISAGGGLVWIIDECQGIINVLQYGVASNGTVTYSRTRAIDRIVNRSNRPMHKRMGHFKRKKS